MGLKSRVQKLEDATRTDIAGRDDSEMTRIVYDHYPDCHFTPTTADILGIMLLKSGGDPMHPDPEIARAAWDSLTAKRDVRKIQQDGKTVYAV